MYSSYFAGIANYNYAAFAMPIDSQSALGISVIRFGVDDIGLLGDGEEGEGQQHGELGGRSVGGDQRGVTVAGGGGPGTS